jgi:hypothetical protein
MKKILIVILLLLVAVSAYAQPPATGKNKIGFDQDAPSLAEVQTYTWKYYADTATTGISLTGVTCTGTVTPYQCEAPFPAFTPGPHTLTLTTSNLAGESVKSLPLNFAFVVTPGAPTGLKIK